MGLIVVARPNPASGAMRQLREALLAVPPSTAWPDSTQTTYNVLVVPPPFTSGVASYDPDIVVVPTVDYGSKLLNAYRRANESLLDGEPLELSLIGLRTWSEHPMDYSVHLVAGFCESVIAQYASLLDLAREVGHFLFSGLVCLEAQFASMLEEFEQWALDTRDDFPPLTVYANCAEFYEGMVALVAFSRALERMEEELTSDQVFSLAAELLAASFEWVADLHLGDQWRSLEGDPKAMGALHGSVLAVLAIALLNPEGRIAGAVSRARWIKPAQVAGESLATAVRESVLARRLALEAERELTRDAVTQAMKEAGAAAQAYLAEGGATRLANLDGEVIYRFAMLSGRPDFVKALTRSYEALGAAIGQIWREVLPFADLRKKLRPINSCMKLLVLTESTAMAKTYEEASRLTRISGEESLLEAAHLYDKRLYDRSFPTLTGDWNKLGFTSQETMPAFASTRLEHRTTLAHLKDLGVAVPELTKTDLTNAMNQAIRIGPLNVPAEPNALVVETSTRGYVVVRKAGSVYESKFPFVFERVRNQLFKDYATLIEEFKTTDPTLYKSLIEDWPSFASTQH